MLEWLKTILGDAYSEEIDKKVSEEIGKGFVSRADFNTVNEAKKGLDEAIKKRDKDLADLKDKYKDADGLSEKLSEFEKTYDTDKAAWEGKLKDAQIAAAIKLAISGKVHDVDMVAERIDKSKIELNEDGSVKMGLKEQVENLQKEKAFLFVNQKKADGPQPADSVDQTPGDASDAALNAAFGITTTT